MLISLNSLTLLLLFLLFQTNASAKIINQKEQVKSLPFVTLAPQNRKLHLIRDYFTLAQHIGVSCNIFAKNMVLKTTLYGDIFNSN